MADKIDAASELSKIAKLNGDFRKNYGTLLGAFLYLRQRRARAFSALGRLVFPCLFGRAGLDGEARLSVVRRRLSDRANASAVSNRSIPCLICTFSENRNCRLSCPVMGRST